ncbi:tail terminator [Mycobacterium phage Arissanae]|nr:tail terminator [Mycobacterium phage Arissanae]
MTQQMPRIQRIVIPLLKEGLGEGVKVGSWVEDIDYRDFPMINIRRIGGIRNPAAPTVHSLPVIEMTAFSATSLIDCENLYEQALDVLYEAVRAQTATPAGRLQSMYETMGATQFSSLFQDSWRIQGLIRLGIRKPRTTT